MLEGYAQISCRVGAVVRDRLGPIESEPMPQRILELLDELSEKDGTSRELRKRESPSTKR
jgi:hypothetical protein